MRQVLTPYSVKGPTPCSGHTVLMTNWRTIREGAVQRSTSMDTPTLLTVSAHAKVTHPAPSQVTCQAVPSQVSTPALDHPRTPTPLRMSTSSASGQSQTSSLSGMPPYAYPLHQRTKQSDRRGQKTTPRMLEVESTPMQYGWRKGSQS